MGNGGKDTEQRTRKKPGRVPTSCAECRRLKLGCDRKVPCGKCVQRGCAAICPDGALTPGRGNRMILANTEELHAQIEAQSRRIRQLEEEIRSVQSVMTTQYDVALPSSSSQPNRMASPPNENSNSPSSTSSSSLSGSGSETLGKSTEDMQSTGVKVEDTSVIDAFGTLTIGQRGESRFLGKTARSEYLIFAPPRTGREPHVVLPRLSHRLVQTSFPESEVTDTDGLTQEALRMLPQLSEAIRLCEIYLEYGKFLYTPVRRHEIFDEILGVIYRRDNDADSFKHYHALALLFIVFALASLFDPTKEPIPVEAREWFYLSRTALQLASPVRETTLVSIQTIIHMAQFLDLVDSGASGDNEAWMYIGHAVRLGHSIGLHLNGARWKLSEDTIDRRNRVFWPLFTLDTWSSFYFGRPPNMAMAYIDCPMPKDKDEKVLPDGNVLPSCYGVWYNKFSALLHTIMGTAFGPKQPSYGTILELDRKIRDFPVPAPWRPTCRDGVPSANLETWMILFTRETTLLNLHRSCFALALQESPHDLCKHKFIPSVVAIYRSAWRISRSLEIVWNLSQFILCRVNLWWSQALSAAIVMCLIVTKSPLGMLAQPALEELNFMIKIFEKAAPLCSMAARLLPPLKRISRKAQETLGHSSPHPYTLDDSPLTPAELDRIGGKTHLLSPTDEDLQGFHAPGTGAVPVIAANPTTTGNTPPSRSSSLTLSDAFEPFSNLQLPQQNLHPTIVQDMRSLAVRPEPGTNEEFRGFYDFPSTMAGQEAMYASFEQRLLEEVQQQQHTQMIVMNRSGHGFVAGGQSHESPFHPGRELYNDYTSPSQQPPAGVGVGGLVLDSTWQSFVEQLGF